MKKAIEKYTPNIKKIKLVSYALYFPNLLGCDINMQTSFCKPSATIHFRMTTSPLSNFMKKKLIIFHYDYHGQNYSYYFICLLKIYSRNTKCSFFNFIQAYVYFFQNSFHTPGRNACCLKSLLKRNLKNFWRISKKILNSFNL